MKASQSLVLLAILFSSDVNAQCVAVASNKKLYCISEYSGIRLGGNPTASEGIAPYSYEWTVIMSSGDIHTILDDPSSSNPSASINSDVFLQLLVTDSLGSVCGDTVQLRISNANSHNMSQHDFIRLGDSIKLNTRYGLNTIEHHPLRYTWTPSKWLSDSTDLYTYATPLDTIQYQLTIENSDGCLFYDTYIIDVIKTVGISEENPTANIREFSISIRAGYLMIQPENQTIDELEVFIHNMTGMEVLRKKLNMNNTKIDVTNLVSGSYVISILNREQLIVHKRKLFLTR